MDKYFCLNLTKQNNMRKFSVNKVCSKLNIIKEKNIFEKRVVSIGAFVAFKVVFTPLENIPSIPPISSYIINIYFV